MAFRAHLTMGLALFGSVFVPMRKEKDVERDMILLLGELIYLKLSNPIKTDKRAKINLKQLMIYILTLKTLEKKPAANNVYNS